jgi:hypothetical protein
VKKGLFLHACSLSVLRALGGAHHWEGCCVVRSYEEFFANSGCLLVATVAVVGQIRAQLQVQCGFGKRLVF